MKVHLIYIQVIWHRLYSTKSAAQKGTMYQLCNILDQTVVPSDLEKNMKAAEDFLLLLLHMLLLLPINCYSSLRLQTNHLLT